jgi:hypothetical protein
VKGRLFAASIGFCAGTFHAPSSSGMHQTVIWIIIGVVLAAAIALASLVPRGQRAAQDRVCPGGSALSQVLVALALGASLHVVGQRASIAPRCLSSSRWSR